MKRKHGIKTIAITALIFLNMEASSSLAQDACVQKLGLQMDAWSSAQVKFWEDIYTKYSSKEWVIHDPINLTHVYGVVHQEAEASTKIKAYRAGLLSISKKISAKKTDFTPDEQKLMEVMEKSEDARTYEFAAQFERFRLQSGVKDSLTSGAFIAQWYLGRMKEILREEGVPEELAFLPFVESSFNTKATSSVGAAGVWQFMPATATKDLKVNSLIDERRDPLKATRAAARFLKSNYAMFESWPLAIMAYHTGPSNIQHAVQKQKTKNPFDLIRIHKSPEFKFASRNYLFEFLAMCGRDFSSPVTLPNFITVSFDHPEKVSAILSRYHFRLEMIKELNPQFQKPILESKSAIPAHYPVRLSGITLEEFRKLEYPKAQ